MQDTVVQAHSTVPHPHSATPTRADIHPGRVPDRMWPLLRRQPQHGRREPLLLLAPGRDREFREVIGLPLVQPGQGAPDSGAPWRTVISADFHAGGSAQLSGELVADGASAPPGDAGVGGQVCLAEDG